MNNWHVIDSRAALKASKQRTPTKLCVVCPVAVGSGAPVGRVGNPAAAEVAAVLRRLVPYLLLKKLNTGTLRNHDIRHES